MKGLIIYENYAENMEGERPLAFASLAGLTLLERQIRTLKYCGCRACVIWLPPAWEKYRIQFLKAQHTNIEVEFVFADFSVENLFKIVGSADEQSCDQFVFVRGDHVVHLDIVRKLVKHGPGISFLLEGEAGPQIVVAYIQLSMLENLGSVETSDYRGIMEIFSNRTDLKAVELSKIGKTDDPKPVGTYCFQIRTPTDLKEGSDVIVAAAQKGGGDLLGEYLHPRPENALVRLLINTRVTPNLISIVTIVLSICSTLLYALGWFRLGVLVTIPIGILDGVDGKLARIKLMFSRMGWVLDSIFIDKLAQTGWIAGIGWFIYQRGDKVLAGYLVLAFLCVDNLIRIIDGIYTYRFKAEQMNHFPRLRKIRAGRNTYAIILMAAGVINSPDFALLGVVCWAALDCIVRTSHLIRMIFTKPFEPIS